jgi:hypothetical protein
MLLEIRSMRIEKHLTKEDGKIIPVTMYVYNAKSQGKSYELIIKKTEKKQNEDIQILLNEVKMFNGIGYFTKEKIVVEYTPNQNQFDNQLFKIDESGIQIKYDCLVPTNRIKIKRPVWIFVGKSALGKSYISSMLANGSEHTKYETDSSPELPEQIYEDVIVVGNKNKFTLKEIKDKIYGEHETIVVNFEMDS